MAALSGVSAQPPIMGNVDPSKIDEIRRTVYVGNLNSQVCYGMQDDLSPSVRLLASVCARI